jgi:hypothetical protein
MFSLFKSFFGSETEIHGKYPSELLEKATNRAIEGVDSRLQALPGCHRRLKPSLITAIDHVVELVGQLPEARDARTSLYGNDPYLRAMFASADALKGFFSRDTELASYRDALTIEPDYYIAMLRMDREEKRVFGVDMQGDVLRRDVAQMTVNFTNEILIDPCGSEEETRRLLMRRAFDHLISLALHEVMESRQVRLELEQQYRLYQRKSATLDSQGWGFDTTQAEPGTNHSAAQAKLEEIESQLQALPAKTELLDAHLETLIKIFSNAADHLYHQATSMIVDRMNTIVQSESDHAHQLSWDDIHSSSGVMRTVMLVKYPASELPRKQKSVKKNIYQ